MASALILPFPKATGAALSPIADFIRIGDAHRQLADMHAGGSLPAQRAVFDASRLRYQGELAKGFRASGAEIVLDTEAAELAAPAKCGGHASYAPWALGKGTPLGREFFIGDRLKRLAVKIAQFAISNQVDVVLSPSHLIDDAFQDDWLQTDHAACLALRDALDHEGGRHIAIDYQIIAAHTKLNDPNFRGELMARTSDLPVDCMWVRASGLNPGSGPFTIRRFMQSISALNNIGKPVIADYLGGLPALALLGFGAISGIAHGIWERERFDAGGWHKFPKPKDEGTQFGRTTRVSIPGLQLRATVKEFELLASARGAKGLLGCKDRSCCASHSDTLKNPHRHDANQSFRIISEMEAVPDLRRETHLLNGPIGHAVSLAHQVCMLKPNESEAGRLGIDTAKLIERLREHSRRMENIFITLDRLHQERGADAPRARALCNRRERAGKAKEGLQ